MVNLAHMVSKKIMCFYFLRGFYVFFNKIDISNI